MWLGFWVFEGLLSVAEGLGLGLVLGAAAHWQDAVSGAHEDC